MCRAVKFRFDAREWKVHFGNPQAKLLIGSKSGQTRLSTWGRRPAERGELPIGACARLTQIHGGRWDKFLPKPVRIRADGFAANDVTGQEQWFAVMPGQSIQGLLALQANETRIYIVTLDSNPEEANFENWPRIIFAPE